DSKGNTIKHKTFRGRVADLKDKLQCVHVVYTQGHQHVGVHVICNTLADEAAKSAVATDYVAVVTHSQMKLDNEILTAVKASAEGNSIPKAYPTKYSYHISAQNVAYSTIPGVGDRMIPNEDQRLDLIKAAHEGVATAHAGISTTVTLLQKRFWWPGLHKQTKQYVLCCDICQQIKGSNIKRPP
ncbi:hypothetical protein NDU88_002597, partial [Pleurodeles waltl]